MTSFLGSPKVQPKSHVLTFGSLAGYGEIIDMWKKAQKIRTKDASTLRQNSDEHDNDYNLTEKGRKMLMSAACLLDLEEDKQTALDSMIRCLKLEGVIQNEGGSVELTWYKLPEWLQVEMIQIFGEYMKHRPWFLFPFGDMLQVSLYII